MSDVMKALQKAGVNPSKDNKNSKKNNSRKKNNSSKSFAYVGAPYNFIPFSSKVKTDSPEILISHADMKDEFLSGEIEYEIEAKTPICIGDGKDNYFYEDAYSRKAIPGSSIRGMIRSHAQILGLSSIVDDIDDYSLMYRDVTGGADKDLYSDELGADTIPLEGKSLSILKNVKAGYVKCVKPGKYVIYHTKPDRISDKLYEMNYYVISERFIINAHLDNPSDKSFEFLFRKRDGNKSRIQHCSNFRIEKVKRGGRTHWVGEQDRQYEPYFEEISYELQGERRITAVGEPGKYSYKGYITGTGSMREKKVLYVIPDRDQDDAHAFEISQDDVRAFEIDFERKKNTLRGNKDFFRLPQKSGEIRPVFYIQKERLYFGFTPRLRLFNKNTIWDGIPDQQKQSGRIDLVKSIFGFTGRNRDDISYKSKVSFSDAILVNEVGEVDKKEVLMGPKPTSYNDYLMPDGDGNAVTYNSPDITLRGIKQYWLRDEKNLLTNQGNGNKNAMTFFHPLDAGARFKGKIRFKNLRGSELGLLLWSIKMEPGCDTNIGMAKPLGYGRIHIDVKNVKSFDYKAAYTSEEFMLSPWKDIDVDSIIDAYKESLKETLGVDDLEKDESIRAFFEMKRVDLMPEPGKIRYMHLGDKKLGLEDEYRNRKLLPTVDQVVKGQKNG